MTRRALRRVTCGANAPGDARHFVRGVLHAQLPAEGDGIVGARTDGSDGSDDVVDRAELLVSEVVTVATRHSSPASATVAVTADLRTVRVEVSDPHRGFAPPRDELDAIWELGSAPTAPGPDGLPLGVVDRLAPRWGVDLTRPGKTVWFELDRD